MSMMERERAGQTWSEPRRGRFRVTTAADEYDSSRSPAWRHRCVNNDGGRPCHATASTRAEHVTQIGEMRLAALLALFGFDLAAAAFPLQIVGGQFRHEPARIARQHLAAALAFGGERERKRLARAGDADVGETPLLFELALFDAAAVRQKFLFHADQEHVRELEALG